MKKAEQIVIDATDKEEGGHYQNLVDAVREAQREAYRAGLERAAAEARLECRGCMDGVKTILFEDVWIHKDGAPCLAAGIEHLELPEELR